MGPSDPTIREIVFEEGGDCITFCEEAATNRTKFGRIQEAFKLSTSTWKVMKMNDDPLACAKNGSFPKNGEDRFPGGLVEVTFKHRLDILWSPYSFIRQLEMTKLEWEKLQEHFKKTKNP